MEGDWDKISNILNPARMRAKIEQAGKKVGFAGVAAVKKGIVSGAPGGETFEPLQALTVWAKGSSKPLIDHGDLVGSITHENIDANTVWIGVKKGAKGSKGNMANIAAVHEFGCTIAVTDKMRRAFAAKFQGIGIRRDTQYIHIPARPFLRPTLNDPDFRQTIGEIYLNALKEAFLP
ncbi:MAG: phage virion morphogenesis protein [Synergistaceae bacterium]|nr:phage virion morphogenesis protein [Synergistaceae bacterium]